jgi:large subunit ribosomal protein L21
MYAVIVTSGKQYKVAENDVLKVDKLEAEVGSIVQFDQVLAMANSNGEIRLGNPKVEGVTISAEVLEQKRDDKIIVFKKKRRHNYRRKNGHRQYITVLRILDVSGKGAVERKNVVKKASSVEISDVETKVTAPKKEVASKPAKKAAATKSSDGTKTASEKSKATSKK